MNALLPKPPFLVFPDQVGGFFLFHNPVAEFSGPQLAQAEAFAVAQDAWLAGGLQYAQAEGEAPGWWGVFPSAQRVGQHNLMALADPGPVLTGPLNALVSFSDYQTAYDRVRQELAKGKTYQVNLTFFLEGKVVSGSPWSWRVALRLWLDLIAAQGREAVFAVLGTAESPGPIIVSASPELFFSRQDNSIEARPMKGTALRHSDGELDQASRQELVSSTKIRAENLMVTDMIRNDLGCLAVAGGVRVPSLFEVESYPTVWQMTSTVQADVPTNTTLATTMTALFPCASITGAPKLSTQAVIAQVETQPRGWYTGTFGWHKPESVLTGGVRSRFSVLIRTLVFDDSDRFRLGVGGGVVWDSTAIGEWDEAWAKARFLNQTRRTFSLTEAVLWEPDGGLFLFEEHRTRLAGACRDFGGRLDEDALAAALDDEVARCQGSGAMSALKLRVLVDPDFSIRVEGEPLGAQPEVLTVALADRPLSRDTRLWRRYKTTERRVYTDHQVADADQTLYYNEAGELTESTSMNLVIEKDGVFLTPALASGLLDGTYRARLLAQGKIAEAVLPVGALKTADRVWLINSVRRWKQARLRSSFEEGSKRPPF